MTKREITEAEREYAQSWCVGCGISVRREFTTGFTVATILGAGILAVAVWFSAPFCPFASTLAVTSIVAACSVILGITGGLSSAQTARRNIRNRHEQIATKRQDVQRGIACEYAGSVEESCFDEKSNPEHPDICIRFANGDECVASSLAQPQHKFHKPPKKHAAIAVLPESQLIVAAKGV